MPHSAKRNDAHFAGRGVDSAVRATLIKLRIEKGERKNPRIHTNKSELHAKNSIICAHSRHSQFKFTLISVTLASEAAPAVNQVIVHQPRRLHI